MQDGVEILRRFLDTINSLIHNAFSRDPRVMTQDEIHTLLAYLSAARDVSKYVAPNLKRPVYTEFLGKSNLARYMEPEKPVVPPINLLNDNLSALYDILNENTDWLPGDDGAPVVWQPTDAERARQPTDVERARAEANRARTEANRARAEANAERLQLNDLYREIREIDDELAAKGIQRLQFSNDPPLREDPSETPVQAPIQGAAFTEGLGARQRALRAQDEEIMEHEAMQQAEGLEASEEELNRRAEGLAAAMHRVQGVGYDLYEKMENIIVDQLMVMRQELHQDKDYNGCFAVLDIAAVARTMRMGAAMPNTQEMRALCEEINTPVTRDMLEAPTNLQRVLEKFLKRMERRDLKPGELERLKRWLEKCNENRLRQLLTLLLRYQIVQKDRVYSDRVFALVSLICEINPDLAHFYNVGLDVFQQRASGENVLRQLLMHTVAQTILQTENPAIDMQQYDDDTMQELALRLQFASIDILTGRIQTQIRIVFTIVVRYCICTMIRLDEDRFARSLDILRRYSAGLTEDENLDIFQYCAQLGVPIDEPE
jgi:CRISPR/Cas system CSM-associated protein Csm2 small subunit